MLYREYAAKVFNEVIPEDDNDLMEFSDSDEDINQVEDMLNAAEKEERRVWRTMQKKLAQPFSSGEDHRFIMYSDDQVRAVVCCTWWQCCINRPNSRELPRCNTVPSLYPGPGGAWKPACVNTRPWAFLVELA